MSENENKIDPRIISSTIQMIESSLSRISDNRAKNRNLAIVVVGAIMGLAFKEKSIANTLLMGFGAITATFLFWYQDYQFHKWRHGWSGMRKRVRQYISGKIDEDDLAILAYFRTDEKSAKFFSKSSSYTFVVLITGAILIILYKYLTLAV